MENNEPDRSVSPGEEKPWWEEDGMPWRKEPGRADYACMAWFGVVAVFSLVLIPTRAWLLGAAPDWLAMITGGRTAVAASGALAGVGQMAHWPVVLAVSSVLSLKFDWIYWWAGKLWGHGLIEVWSGRSERARKRNQRAIAFTHKYETWAIFVTYLPIPMPAAVVYAALGAAGTKLSKFLIVSFISSVISSGLYMYLGWQIGEPAVELINAYGQWLWYLSIAIIVGMIAVAWWKSRQPKSDEPVIPGPAI